MASAINNGTFTFNQEELKDLAGVIHELVYANEELNKIHEIHEGVKYNQQIVFAGKIGLMGKAVQGCEPNKIEGVALTEKSWTPVREDFRLMHCSVDVDQQDKLINQMARYNDDFYNIIEGTNSDVGQFLVAKVLEGFHENLLRKAWFSDTLAETIANGGIITDGTDVDYFNTFDGLWKQLQANIPAGNKYHVVIGKNAGADYDAQSLDVGDSINILKAMWLKADSRLRGLQGAVFLVTRSIYDGYVCDLEEKQNQGAGNTMITENGITTLRYKGVEIVNMEVWDRNIESYFNDGTKHHLPHRAVLTVPSNIPLATLATDDFGTVDAFYDRVTKMNYIDGIYSIDVKHMENYLTVVAY